MKRTLLFLLLLALFMPWAAQAQTRETLRFDFEDNAIPSSWSNDDTYPWVVVSESQDSGHSGTYCIKSSNSGQSSSSSTISATFTFVAEGSISFLGGIFGEGTSTVWDKCIFSIDDTQQFVYGALQTWTIYDFEVDAGTHTFTWSYTKDSSVDPTGDAFFVDNVVVDLGTASATPKPTDLVVSNVTTNSATLGWTENGTATSWQIMLDGDESNLINASTNPYTLQGLTDNTTYSVKVRSVGSENSAWSSAISFTTKEACPDGLVCIGEGTATNNFLPTYNYYNYSLTEQIYTAEEIGQAAAISSVDIYSVGTVTRTLEFYMVSTEKETFTDGNDWITATANDLVFNGSVTFAANSWNTIEFDPPFIYDGNSNVALIVRDMTGSYVTAINFYVFDAPSQAIRIYRDASAYDLANPGEGTVLNVKNRVRFAVSEPPTCFKPTGLTAEVQGGHGAVLNWNSDAPAWQILLNNDIIDVTTKPYTLTGLAAETDYTVGVRGNCGDDDFSDWAYVSFTTDVACPAPTNLSANPYLNSADISWVGYSDGYEMEYALTPTGNKSDELAYSFEGDFEGWTTIDADGDGFNWELASVLMAGYIIPSHDGEDCVSSQSYDSDAQVPLTPDNYLVSPQIILGGSLTFWACAQDASYAAEHFGVAVSVTGNTSPRDFTTIQEWDMTAKRVEAPLANKVLRQYLSKNGNRANRDQGTWYQYTVDLSGYQGVAGYVAIRHFDCTDKFYLDVDDITIVEGVLGDIEWIPVGTVTSPYTLTGLESETAYMVRVRANCGEDGVSDWVTIGFTTHGACEMPINLAANDITSNSAKLSWTGYQESYILRYRHPDLSDPTAPATIILNYPEAIWEDGSGYQMLLDADATAYGTIIPETGGLTTSGDASEETYAEFEYKIPTNADGSMATTNIVGPGTSQTLQIPAGIYDWCITNPSPDDRIWIASSLGNVPGRYDDFEFLPGGTYEFVLSAHGTNDGVDLTTTIPMTDWTEVTVNEVPYTLTGLTPNTQYEWQIQGVNANCGELEWSEIQNFTTLAGFTQTIELVSGTNYIASYVDITLADLEDALAATWTTGHNITIKSQNKNVVYRAGRWVGQLNESNFDVASMYVILIDYATEITLEGTPINPADHPITVPAGGTVYIGFPLTTSMTPADAFAGFAANGDVVKSQNQNSTFRGGRWVGQLSTLEPGKGYKYISNATSERTLVFPAE